MPVDEATLMVTCELIEASRTDFDLRAVLAVEYVGIPCDRRSVSEYCARHDMQLMFDSAATFGAELNSADTTSPENGRTNPSQHFYCYSFHATKPLSSVEGGAVFCPNVKDATAIREMRNFGISSEDKACTNQAGHNCKMSELHAIVGNYNLRHYPEAVENRCRFATELMGSLAAEVPNLVPSVLRPIELPNGTRPVWWFIPYVFDRSVGES